MAQWRIDKQEYKQPHNVTLFETYMRANEYGYIESEGACARSAFGERIAVQLSPKIQSDAVYGLDPREFETLTFGGGTAESVSSMFRVSASSTPNSYGLIRSINFLRYRPGQGCVCRFTAAFSANPVGFTQRAGLFNQEQALQVGYDNVTGKFGVLRANGGKAHIERFTFTTLGNGNVTVTLNGTTFTAVTLNTTTLDGNIGQLAQGLQTQPLFNTLYLVQYDQTRISFLSRSLGPQTGAFDVTSTDGLAFTTAVLQAGVAQTNNWTFQEDFNIDKLDGTGTSGVILDKSKLNIYQINFRWLGAGEIRYAIENPSNGDMIFFHHEHYANRYETPHLDNPSLKIGYVAANVSGGTGTVTCKGSSFLGALEGTYQQAKLPFSVTATRTDSMNIPGSNYHLISLKNKLIYQGKINTRDLLPVRLVGSVNTTGDPAIISLFWNPVPLDYFKWINQTEFSGSLYATQSSAGLFTLQAQAIPAIAAFHVTNGDTVDVDLSHLAIHVPPNSIITAVIKSTSNITAASASFIYVED